MSRRAALLIAVLAGAAGVACRKTVEKTLYVPTERANLVLDLQFPPNGNDCADVGTWLLHLDTAGGPAWSHTLVFDASHNLYGCSGLALQCNPAPAFLAIDLLGLKKVEIEGIKTVTPATWFATSSTSAGLQVVCRGVADASVIPGSIVVTSTSPTPAPSPTSAQVDVTAHVQVLRVGESNTLSGPTQPNGLWAAAASLSSTRFGIGLGADCATDPCGRILYAGGSLDTGGGGPINGIYAFSPQTLTFTSAGTLSSPETGLTATTVIDAGQPAVVFAGGATLGNGAVPTMNLDVFHADGTLTASTLGQPRCYQSAVYLQGDGSPVVALVGGDVPVGGQSPRQWNSPYDKIVAVVPAGSAAAICGAGPGIRSCEINVSTGNRGLAIGERIGGSPDSLFIGGGTGNTSYETVPSDTLSPPAATTSVVATYIASASAVIDTAGNPVLDGNPIMFGGSSGSDPFTALSLATTSYLNGATLTAMTTTISPARAFLTATPLRDHTILLGGGNTAGSTSGLTTLERFRPVPGGNPGVVESLPGGVSLLFKRLAHTATRIEGSRTWLDGAVLFAGGGASGTPAELFVPSYRCNSANLPVSEAVAVGGARLPIEPGSNPDLPDACDRGRVKQPVTDPLTGSFFTPP